MIELSKISHHIHWSLIHLFYTCTIFDKTPNFSLIYMIVGEGSTYQASL